VDVYGDDKADDCRITNPTKYLDNLRHIEDQVFRESVLFGELYDGPDHFFNGQSSRYPKSWSHNEQPQRGSMEDNQRQRFLRAPTVRRVQLYEAIYPSSSQGSPRSMLLQYSCVHASC